MSPVTMTTQASQSFRRPLLLKETVVKVALLRLDKTLTDERGDKWLASRHSLTDKERAK